MGRFRMLIMKKIIKELFDPNGKKLASVFSLCLKVNIVHLFIYL